MLKRILKLIPKSFKKRGALVVALIPLKALLDLVGLAVLLPMLVMVLDSDGFLKNKIFIKIYDFLGFSTYNHFVIFLVCSVFAVIVIKSLVNLLIQNNQNKYLLSLYRYFSSRLFSHLYSLGLLYIKNSNISQIAYNINAVCYNFSNSFIASMMRIGGDVIFTCFLLIALLVFNPPAGLILLASFVPVVLIYGKVVRSRLKMYGKLEYDARKEQQKLVQETFKGYSEMEINQAFPLMKERFDIGLDAISSNRLRSSLIQRISSYVIEISVSLVVCVMVLFSIDASDPSVRVFLGVFSVAIIRMLPAVSSIINSWNMIKNTEYTIDAMEELMGLDSGHSYRKPKQSSPIKFDDSIKVNNLTFSYGQKDVLKDISFEIHKGECFGIKGRTGSGKSTLFNLLLGLLIPQEGTIQVDGVPLLTERIDGWHALVGYVPQDVFIADVSLAENIALGQRSEDIDRERVKMVLDKVSLHDFVQALPEGIDTMVGDGGSRVSGGQRQRIGIARALYKGAKVMFFDEATSSLDIQTEEEINGAIRGLSDKSNELTIIIISHRPSSIEFCDRILTI